MAPEILQDKEITEKSDVYSLGMVLIEMITIEIPFTDFNLTRSGVLQKIRDGIEPSLLDRISDIKARDFIKKLINPNPNKRPTVQDILNDEFLQINEKEDNRKIKLIKIKKKKKKRSSIIHNLEEICNSQYKLLGEVVIKKNLIPFKRDFEENPYFDDSSKNSDKKVEKREGEIKLFEKSVKENSKVNSPDTKNKIIKTSKNENDNSQLKLAVTSSHEGCMNSKYCSDVYHTATDHFNLANYVKSEQNQIIPVTDDSVQKKHLKLKNLEQLSSSPPYQIFDEHYNVLLKFLISQDGKLHEIQFTYNLLRDNIPDMMEEIQNEFNFSQENLNHIYETLKKISIYSKFYKHSDILHDNSA